MIVYFPPEADILKSTSEVLVNPVNAVGVMGAGLAKQFAKAFPEILKPYREACKSRKLVAGGCILLPVGRRIIACLATKDDWKHPSRLEYIRLGMQDLLNRLAALYRQPKSVAVPALGCGLGGLEWMDVEPVIREACEKRKDIVWEIYRK